jgi:hypothetical protein
MRAWLAALGLLALVATASTESAQAQSGGGTSTTVDGTTVTITVHIDICCFDNVGTTLVAHVMNEVRAAQDMWNAALAKLLAHGCFDIKVVFDVHLLNKGDARNPEYHQVTIDFDRPCAAEDNRSYAADDKFPPKGLYEQDKGFDQPPDFDAPYRRSLEGLFCASFMTTQTYAHEIGHFMGLRDDYSDILGDSICFSGRGGTLMCNGKTIDQQLADRLINIVNTPGRVPQCWKGTLKIASTFMPNVPQRTWSDTWKADFRLVVDATGGVSGRGINRRASPVKGHPYGGTPVQEMPFSVSGDADRVRLRLRFRETYVGPASPPGSADFSRAQMVLHGNDYSTGARTYVFPVIAPGVAKGQFDISFFGQTGSIDGQLECTTCAGYGSKQ